MDYKRYALYYAPPEKSALADFGNHWLGWNPETKESLKRPEYAALDQTTIQNVTTSPAHYGFHGTLKPPFQLKEGKTFKELNIAVNALAQKLSFFVCGPLQLKTIGRFLALVPTNCDQALARLAGKCVAELDDFRAPPSEAELAKRRAANLTDRQDQLLMQWGYPYVMEEFRFHLTLTNKLEDRELSGVTKTLHRELAGILSSAFEVKEICLFGDPGDGQPFHLLKRYEI